MSVAFGNRSSVHSTMVDLTSDKAKRLILETQYHFGRAVNWESSDAKEKIFSSAMKWDVTLELCLV